MQRARHLLSVLVIAAALGCSQQQPKAVFVDLDGIIASEPAFDAPKIETPKPPASIGPESLALNPMSGRTLVDRSHGQIQEARRILEADRLQAQRTLERRLRTIYIADVDAKSSDEIGAVKARETALLDAAFLELREVFEAYAEQRGQLVVQLELLTNPQRHRFDYKPPEPGGQIVQQEQAEIASLKKQIAQLDDKYDADAQSILAGVRDTIDRELTRLQAEIEGRRTAAGDRATAEAAKQVRESRAGLEGEIGKSSSLHVPAAPGRKVSVGGTSTPAPAPTTAVRGLLQGPADRRLLLEQQLEIWLKINGWTRAASTKEGRDATREFKEWRATYTAGR